MTDEKITDLRNAICEPTYKDAPKDWNEDKIVAILVQVQELLDRDFKMSRERKAEIFYNIWEEIYSNEGV